MVGARRFARAGKRSQPPLGITGREMPRSPLRPANLTTNRSQRVRSPASVASRVGAIRRVKESADAPLLPMSVEGFVMSLSNSQYLGARPPGPLTAALAAALLTSACAQTGLETGSAMLQDPAATTTVTQSALPPIEPPVTLKPETAAAIKESRAQRGAGDKAKALATLDKAPGSDTEPALLEERGLLALEMGQVDRAEELLRKADDPKAPDWRVSSALGAALSAKGKQQEAQIQFSKALALAPDHPSILNNLALSYALDGKHGEAEKLLRRVAERKESEPQAQQNLALILGLQGNIEEARKVSEATLPADKAQLNVSYLERLQNPDKVSRAEPVTTAGDIIRAARASADGNGQPIMQLGTPN